jgi:hypothetical protein
MSQQTVKKDSWIESHEYPSSRTQIIISVVLLILTLAAFLTFSTGEPSISTSFYEIFASLSFSVIIFPYYFEFSGISSELASQRMVKIKIHSGLERFMPTLSLVSIFLLLPLIMVFIAPSTLFWSSITGIITGFAIQRLTFFLYMKNWSKIKGLQITRYNIVTRNELGKRVIIEHGLKAGKI